MHLKYKLNRIVVVILLYFRDDAPRLDDELTDDLISF